MGTFRFDWLDPNLRQLLELTLGGIGDMPVVSSTPTRLVLGAGATDFRITMTGTGFAYVQSGGQISDITAGTITSIQLTGYDGYSGLGYAFTDLNLSMATLANHVFAGNWLAVNRYLMRGDDRIEGLLGLNVIETFAGNDTVFGGDYQDILRGGAGDDNLYGRIGEDDLFGGADNDLIFGGQRDAIFTDWVDELFGGTGHDDLIGGSGIDVLTGGAGRDAFIFSTRLSATQRDTITDFVAVDDVIRLDNAAFTAFTTLGTMVQSRFHLGVSAADTGDRIIYDRAEGVLSYDRDGRGGAAAVVFARVDPGTALGYQDIVII